MSGPNMSNRSSGKPAAKQTAPTPATPYDFKRETKQDTIDDSRLPAAHTARRSVVCCLLSKKTASAVVKSELREQVFNLQQKLGVLEMKASNVSAANKGQGTAGHYYARRRQM